MHRKQILFFDLDGTLTDSAPGILNSVTYALEKMGIRVEDRRALYRFIGPPLLDSFRDYYGMDSKRAEQAVAFYREYFSAGGLFENSVYEGIPSLLADLRAAGKTLAVATSKPEAFTHRILERFDLAKYFDFIGAATLDESRNQKHQVVAHTLALCGHPPLDSVVMVGDRHHDVEGARLNGLETIGVLYGFGDRAELEQAGAAAIAETVADLRKILLG